MKRSLVVPWPKRFLGRSYLVLPLAGITLVCSCDTAPPSYPVPTNTLRLIPEAGSIDANAGSVFVLVELAGQLSEGKRPIVYVNAIGALAEALPGPSLCDESAVAGDGGSGGTGGSSAATSAGLVLPDNSLIAVADVGGRKAVKQGGFLVRVPAGHEGVQLSATVYAHEDKSGTCKPEKPTLLAIGSARIERENAAEDAGTLDAAAASGGGTGGTGAMGGGGGEAGASPGAGGSAGVGGSDAGVDGG